MSAHTAVPITEYSTDGLPAPQVNPSAAPANPHTEGPCSSSGLALIAIGQCLCQTDTPSSSFQDSSRCPTLAPQGSREQAGAPLCFLPGPRAHCPGVGGRLASSADWFSGQATAGVLHGPLNKVALGVGIGGTDGSQGVASPRTAGLVAAPLIQQLREGGTKDRSPRQSPDE